MLVEFVAFDSPRARTLNLAGILALLALWPTERLNLLPVRSLWVTLFGVEPYSTGITRSLSHLLHGDLATALSLNRLVLVVFVTIVVLILYNLTAWARSAGAARQTL